MEVVARYKQADVAWKVGRIMLKYRPIAPKPASSCASATAGGAGAGAQEASRTTIGKRKSCAKGRKRGWKSTRREECSIITTLPLMPETPERKEEPAPAQVQTTSSDAASPTASFQGHVPPAPPCFPGAPTWQVVAPTPVRPVGSWVTVEKVTDTWRSGKPVVWDDEAVKRILERDACPAFVSDELETVTWTNSAYKKMVVGTTTTTTAEVVEEEDGEEVTVALVSRSGMLPEGVTCFTCRVRVRYACRSRRGTMSMAAPCDVWRLADGKLVWRLDVKAALSLGLGC